MVCDMRAYRHSSVENLLVQDGGNYPTVHRHNQLFHRCKGCFGAAREIEPQRVHWFRTLTNNYISVSIIKPLCFVK
jgi:hypothetical protein